jgi:hypothetical protein
MGLQVLDALAVVVVLKRTWGLGSFDHGNPNSFCAT